MSVEDGVVIAAFRWEGEAESARKALEEAGIPAESGPRNDAIERLCADAFDSGFDVVVASGDSSRAIAALRRVWPDEIDITVEPVTRCPHCGSDAVTRLPRIRLFVLSAAALLVAGAITGQRDLFLLVIGIIGVLLVIAHPNLCRSCGERWRGEGSRIPPENATEPDAIGCPRCGSLETETIDRRRHRALTLLVNWIIPPTLLVWPFLKRYRCMECQHEWR